EKSAVFVCGLEWHVWRLAGPFAEYRTGPVKVLVKFVGHGSLLYNLILVVGFNRFDLIAVRIALVSFYRVKCSVRIKRFLDQITVIIIVVSGACCTCAVVLLVGMHLAELVPGIIVPVDVPSFRNTALIVFEALKLSAASI